MDFKSEFFDDADELCEAKDDAVTLRDQKRRRLDIVRKFSNGLATMTEEQARNLGRKEITNHLTTYSKLLGQESMFQSMVTGTNALLEIIVSTGDPERDFVTGQRLAKAINEGAIHNQGKFADFWRKAAGEIVIAGGAPAVFEAKYGWCPNLSMDLIFPKDTELNPDRATYAFEPKEYSYGDLKKMLAACGDREKGHIYAVDNIKNLIKTIKWQIKNRTKDGQGFSNGEVTNNARDVGGLKAHTVDAWVYYEIKFRDNGSRYVSKTVFVDAMQTTATEDPETGVKVYNENGKLGDDDSSSARIILHIEEAYADAYEWLKMVMVDAEIGGVKTVDSLRGVAELMFPSASEMENLLNLLLEGDKARARPRLKAGSTARKDEILKWNIETDPFVPEGVEEFEFKTNNQHLQTPWAMLDRNSSSITGAPVANSPQGGELRVQQQERQQANSGVQTNRLAEAYNILESILETCVRRILTGTPKAGTEGYEDILWIREKLKEQEIDYTALAKREHGRFKFLRIRAKRIIGNGDPVQQVATADWMMANLNYVEPASRPVILQRAFALRTGDPDLAEMAIRTPQVILNQQRLIAENEVDTIMRRAAAGIETSPQPDDIHHNHIQSHLVDAQALLAANDLRKWDMLEVIGFVALMKHIGEHIQILISNPATQMEGNQFLQPYQELAASSKPILAEVQQQQQEAQQQMDPEKAARLQLELAKLELESQKFGLKVADTQDIWKNRNDRTAQSQRSQYASEVQNANRLALEVKKAEDQKQAAKAKPAAKKP